MDRIDLTPTRWFKSSRSNAQSACVEVGAGLPGAVPVRDSKDPQGPALVFGPAAWRTFVTALHGGGLSGDC
ncbi:DUF397 domain-containing protein [Kitasatospora sp. NBC_01302]|uniref:DUF397 domain-containing protein n=1 Tax=Kitasatospora sp. NBC_01302 TaxID=2903575 RepID=UPI002E162686|nr:DUF397 domain-containing protein [Kitasatospora sp. NBC_01302]